MSSNNPATGGIKPDLVDKLLRFFRDYYHDEMCELAEKWPKNKKWVTVDWRELLYFDRDIGNDYLTQPGVMDAHLRAAVQDYDYPYPPDDPIDDSVEIRVVGIGDDRIYRPVEIVQEDPDGYIGVRGEIAKATTPAPLLTVGVFECQRCGSLTRVPQNGETNSEPHECSGCDRKGPFDIDMDKSETVPYCKLRVQMPPDDMGEMQEEYIDCMVHDELVWDGDDTYGLIGRTGEPVTVYGTLDPVQKGDSGKASRIFENRLQLDAIEFESEKDEISISEHREAFESFAAEPDAVETFKRSIEPSLYATDEWEVTLELLVAYLFGAPRIDIPDGPTIRGDIHALIISDYGMGKSVVSSAVAQFSPKCIKESVTGMASDVGLLAAAVEDDFSDNQWTLQPGILVRANGGHVILDEIDKTDADLERMNQALEEQIIDVNKAGQSATYNSRVGVLAMGNPDGARFNEYDPISDQIGIDQSLLSRFDGIVTMRDTPDVEQDAAVATTQLESYVEAFQYEHGDREELDQLDRVVELDVGRAWIAYARENVYPELTMDHVERICDWYAEDARRLNETFDDAESGNQMPAPISARAVMAAIRYSVAFARVHLRDKVAPEDVERAIELSKALIGQNFDGDHFVPQESRRPQKDRYDSMRKVLRVSSEPLTISAIAERANTKEDDAENFVRKFTNSGDIGEPEPGQYRWSG